ncbi:MULTISPECIES: cupin domain-containing protein [unclassified Pseudonocardia]|jgi:quercetin dioxygenase-like cupin family protein|uniref:cupin domain-containing protein n=1 Tax=unclassified Pseudonocardia TaxID=2619320 RepID=UPI000AEAB0A5|nr:MULTISPECIES: cupin domain-containing protein [unclassified Pseudonocardia]MBN9102705.1 cupin domain-containing protein [Pseudonocardia sp.]
MSFRFRRVVTGHSEDGKAVIRSDEIVSSAPRLPGYEARVVWCTGQLPASNDEDVFDDGAPGPKGARVLFRVAEFDPAEAEHTNMHRTETQDVALVLSGRLDMVLDSGEVVEQLTAGDVLVQRGTMHSWVARGDEPVRVLFVLIDALPVQVGDVVLREDLSALAGRASPMPQGGEPG